MGAKRVSKYTTPSSLRSAACSYATRSSASSVCRTAIVWAKPSDPQALAEWFYRGANQGSLATYLEGFAHTIAVLQTEEALERVAYEQAADLSEDGVVYFETRFAPIFHTQKGLSHQQVVSAVLKGLERGRKDFGVAP